MRKIVTAAFGMAAIVLLPMNANAAPVATVDLITNINDYKPAQTNPTGVWNGVGQYFANTTGSQSGVKASPWGDNTSPYNAVSGNGSSATYDLGGLLGKNAKSFSFIWGTADPNPAERNLLEFFLGGGLVYSTNASVLGMVQNAAYFVTFDNFEFDTVKFTNGANPAFEYANVSATPVPLPAAGWMLLAGVGGLVAMRRRRKV
ncbi:hypothetical protein IWQ55_006516 [Labrenzia sp. EL_208]|nr:hypothetical protein [Labrenzia sp. EL_132]MBG6233276.1 hypothetical protein [Labrenzia sp. EL_208]